MVVSTCKLHLYQEICRSSRQLPFFGRAGVEASVTWHTGFSQWWPLFVDSRRQIERNQNWSLMCEIRLTKLSCAAQQVGIVHFYAVTEIKGLSCRLWWMREWSNLLTSTLCGLPVCHMGSREWCVTKIWGPRCNRTNWFLRVNGARDNGIRLYYYYNNNNNAGLILGLRPANERRHYIVALSLIGWAQA